MANYHARAAKVSFVDLSPRMLFMNVNMVAIARLICICEENVKHVG